MSLRGSRWWSPGAGALWRALRTAQTDDAIAVEAKHRLLDVLADGGLQVVDIERADLEHSAVLCAAHTSGLRTPDALHAAVAHRLRTMLITADKGLATGCRFHGIGCELVGA